jgi:hypothetical protein
MPSVCLKAAWRLLSAWCGSYQHTAQHLWAVAGIPHLAVHGLRGTAHIVVPLLQSDPNTKILRELYIGNIPAGMSELQLQEFFNSQMKIRHLTKAPGNPCVQ